MRTLPRARLAPAHPSFARAAAPRPRAVCTRTQDATAGTRALCEMVGEACGVLDEYEASGGEVARGGDWGGEACGEVEARVEGWLPLARVVRLLSRVEGREKAAPARC